MVRRHRPRDPGRDGARLQPLGSGDARAVEGQGDHLRSGPARRREPGGGRDPARLRRARHPVLLGPPRLPQPAQPGRPLLRPGLRALVRPRLRVRHPRVHGPQRGHRGLEPLRDLHRVAHRRAQLRGAERSALDDHARRLRALPEAALRLHGGGLRLAALVAAPHRRAPRARGRQRIPRAHDERHRVLQAQLLDLHRVRRPLRRRRHPLDGRRPHRLRDRLPAPRLEVPARHRALPEPAPGPDLRREQAQDPLGQRGRPVPLPRRLPPRSNGVAAPGGGASR